MTAIYQTNSIGFSVFIQPSQHYRETKKNAFVVAFIKHLKRQKLNLQGEANKLRKHSDPCLNLKIQRKFKREVTVEY